MITQFFAQISNCSPDTKVDSSGGGSCLTNLPTTVANQAALTNVLSLLFGIMAAVTVIIIIIQGIKFSTSQGDPQKATDARKSIIYAIIGLVVSLSAEAVVRVVISKL